VLQCVAVSCRVMHCVAVAFMSRPLSTACIACLRDMTICMGDVKHLDGDTAQGYLGCITYTGVILVLQ